jgi:type IV pilus assembly protein PilA
MLQHSYKKQQKGFTIIELLVVIVVIGILLALLLPNLFSAQARARDTQRKNHLKTIKQELESYYNDKNHYPGATTYVADMTPEYIAALPADPKTAAAYVYAPTPAACTTALRNCTDFNISATLENTNDASYPTYTLNGIN